MLDLFLYIWYHFLGYAACHQLIDRTIFFGGRPLFVCCRCSGIYIGYSLSYLFIYITRRSKARYFPPRKVVFAGLFVSSLMFLDVGTVMLGLRHGMNDLRIITGLLAGMSIPFAVFPAINKLTGGEEKKVLDGIIPFIFLIIVNGLIFFIIKSGKAFLFWPFFLIIAAGFILIYINLNSILILFFMRLIGLNRNSFYKVIILSFILTFLEILPVYCLYKYLGIKD
jgi:uncharacterized membrane protein